MKIKINGSTVKTLTQIVTKALPMVIHTGNGNHLRHVKPDASSKGKAILFTWKKNDFRMTENLIVQERDFTYTWTQTPDALNVQAIVQGVYAGTIIPKEVDKISVVPAVPVA